MRFRFTIRDFVWLAIAVVLAAALWISRSETRRVRGELETLKAETEGFLHEFLSGINWRRKQDGEGPMPLPSYLQKELNDSRNNK